MRWSLLRGSAGLRPREVVQLLDAHVVGQDKAKVAVAVALRNRWRCQQLAQKDPQLAADVTPKNILMLGPTGVGKSEIARRLAKLTDAPFVRVEATAFTEVGYHGRDVDTIIKDLADVAVHNERQRRLRAAAHSGAAQEDATEERILDALLGPQFRDAAGREVSRLGRGRAGAFSKEHRRPSASSCAMGRWKSGRSLWMCLSSRHGGPRALPRT